MKAKPKSKARTPGRRGQATREKLLECVASLLEKKAYRELAVMEIARCAGTSPATFYQYFPTVEDAVLVLAQRMADEARTLGEIIEGSTWRGAAGARAAERLVDGFFDLWEHNRAVLRVVDLSIAEGDLRFQNIRSHMLNEVTARLRDVIAATTRGARRDLDPMAHAAALVSMLAHVAAHRYGYEFWGIPTKAIRSSAAAILLSGVSGSAAK